MKPTKVNFLKGFCKKDWTNVKKCEKMRAVC